MTEHNPEAKPADDHGDEHGHGHGHGNGEGARQRAIDLVQTLTAGGMLYVGHFDVEGDKPLWLLGTVVLAVLVVHEKDSKYLRVTETCLIVAIPVAYGILGGVDMAYLLTGIVMCWNGIDWLISLLNLFSSAKKAAVKGLKTLG